MERHSDSHAGRKLELDCSFDIHVLERARKLFLGVTEAYAHPLAVGVVKQENIALAVKTGYRKQAGCVNRQQFPGLCRVPKTSVKELVSDAWTMHTHGARNTRQ